MRPYAERRASRIARLQARAASLRATGESTVNAASARAACIPLGQPLQAPSHHSYKRDRNFRDRIQAGFARGFKAIDEAATLDRRADAA